MTPPDLDTAPARDGARVREKSILQGHPVVGALSPSRASDFTACPLLYRYRAIDRLPERPSRAAFRGTLVHEVLDRLFDLPSAQRDLTAATGLLAPALDDLLDLDPDAAFALVEAAAWPADDPPVVPDELRGALLQEASDLLAAYFGLEDPRTIEPLDREPLVEAELDEGLVLRGYIDRLDATDGRMRVVDYKTGRAPTQAWEQAAMFQMRFYALIVHRMTGHLPDRLQLLYLGNREVLTYQPDHEDLQRFERKLRAIWTAITRAADTGDFRPRKSGRCQWCSFQQLCPEFGGTVPPLPERSAAGDARSVEV